MSVWLAAAERLAIRLAGAALLCMMLVGMADILLTGLLGVAIPGALESSESFMVACIFLPLAWTQARGGHLAMGFLRQHLGSTGRRAMDVWTSLCGLGFYGLLAWQGWLLAWRSVMFWEYAAGLVNFPLYPAKVALALGLTLMVLRLLMDVATALTGDALDG